MTVCTAQGGVREEEEDDGLPDTLNPDEVVDKRYKGGHIPSKVFRTLQRAVGDDTPEVPSHGNVTSYSCDVAVEGSRNMG